MKDYEYIVYKQMCCGCCHEKQCHDECEYCDDYLERLENYQATKKKRYKDLTQEQKFSIYHEMKNACRYTQKEIAEMFNVSVHNLKRVVGEIDEFVRTTLQAQKL